MNLIILKMDWHHKTNVIPIIVGNLGTIEKGTDILWKLPLTSD